MEHCNHVVKGNTIIDEGTFAKEHWNTEELRKRYAEAAGKALALSIDQHILDAMRYGFAAGQVFRVDSPPSVAFRTVSPRDFWESRGQTYVAKEPTD